MNIKSLHHIAIICSDYEHKACYAEVLGFDVIKETYRAEQRGATEGFKAFGDYATEFTGTFDDLGIIKANNH